MIQELDQEKWLHEETRERLKKLNKYSDKLLNKKEKADDLVSEMRISVREKGKMLRAMTKIADNHKAAEMSVCDVLRRIKVAVAHDKSTSPAAKLADVRGIIQEHPPPVKEIFAELIEARKMFDDADGTPWIYLVEAIDNLLVDYGLAE